MVKIISNVNWKLYCAYARLAKNIYIDDSNDNCNGNSNNISNSDNDILVMLNVDYVVHARLKNNNKIKTITSDKLLLLILRKKIIHQ